MVDHMSFQSSTTLTLLYKAYTTSDRVEELCFSLVEYSSIKLHTEKDFIAVDREKCSKIIARLKGLDVRFYSSYQGEVVLVLATRTNIDNTNISQFTDKAIEFINILRKHIVSEKLVNLELKINISTNKRMNIPEILNILESMGIVVNDKANEISENYFVTVIRGYIISKELRSMRITLSILSMLSGRNEIDLTIECEIRSLIDKKILSNCIEEMIKIANMLLVGLKLLDRGQTRDPLNIGLQKP